MDQLAIEWRQIFQNYPEYPEHSSEFEQLLHGDQHPDAQYYQVDSPLLCAHQVPDIGRVGMPQPVENAWTYDGTV